MKIMSHLAFVVCIVFLFTAFSMGAVGTPAYEISVEDSLETPERTVTLAGDEYTINSVAAQNRGEQINVIVTAPDDSEVSVDLYNDDQRLVDNRKSEGDGIVSFQTDSMDYGTYSLALFDGDEYVDVVPVVINGYEIETQYDDSVEPEGSVSFSATVSETLADTDPNNIRVVVWNDDNTVDKTLDHDTGAVYEQNFSVDQQGKYDVYVVVEGDERIGGEPVMLAVTDEGMLTVDQEADDDDGDGADDDDGDGADDDDGDGADDDDGDGADDDDGADDVNETTDHSEINQSTESDQQNNHSVISPTEDDDSGTNDAMPFGLISTLATLVISVILIMKLAATSNPNK